MVYSYYVTIIPSDIFVCDDKINFKVLKNNYFKFVNLNEGQPSH